MTAAMTSLEIYVLGRNNNIIIIRVEIPPQVSIDPMGISTKVCDQHASAPVYMGFRSSEFPLIPSDGRHLVCHDGCHDVIGNLCIETCQVYRWGPEYVPFQGFILIGQVLPKLWPFIYQTNDRTRCYDVTIILLLFPPFFSRTGTH